MPVVSSKITPQELDAVAEYANRHGITVSNLIRMVLVREVASPRVLTSHESQNAFTEESQNGSIRSDYSAPNAPRTDNALVDLVRLGKRKSRLDQIMAARSNRKSAEAKTV